MKISRTRTPRPADLGTKAQRPAPAAPGNASSKGWSPAAAKSAEVATFTPPVAVAANEPITPSQLLGGTKVPATIAWARKIGLT